MTVLKVALVQFSLSIKIMELFSLAPETPFPGGDTDVSEATKYIFENASTFNIDPSKIVLTGDSAGGFFTLVTWYRLKDYFKKTVQPALLSFIYPAFGYRFDTPRLVLPLLMAH